MAHWHESIVFGQKLAGSTTDPRAPTPNASLKWRTNGRLLDPVWWYAVHFCQPRPGVLPLVPA
jgi:hypothetical protein